MDKAFKLLRLPKRRNKKSLTGRDEVNLIDLPLSIYGGDAKVIESDYKGNVRECKISVWDPEIKNYKYGYVRFAATDERGYSALSPGDEDILMALLEYCGRDNFTERAPILKSRNQVLTLAGMAGTAKYYDRLQKSFERISSIRITTDCFRNKIDRTIEWKSFGIVSEFTVVTERKGKKGSGIEFEWGLTFWKSLQAGNYRYIDMDLYKRISNHAARKLYRVIDRRFSFKHIAEFPVVTLVRDILQYKAKDVNTDWYCKNAIASLSKMLWSEGFIDIWGFKYEEGKLMVKFQKGDGIRRLDLGNAP